MTEITYRHDMGVTEIIAKGHSGYSTRGTDIVCASISTLLLTFAIYMQKQNDAVTTVDQDDGYLYILITDPWQQYEKPYEMLMTGLREIEGKYKQFVRLTPREKKKN